MKKQNVEKVIVEMVGAIKTLVKEELETLDDVTKSKWQVVDAAKNVFNANYSFTNFPENSHDGTVGVTKPTLLQLDTFSREIRAIGSITVIDTEENDGETVIALRVKLHEA